MEWTRSWGNQNEPLLTIPKAGLYPKKVMHVWKDWKGVSVMSSFWNAKQLIPKSTALLLDQLKAPLNKKRLNLANRKCVIFQGDNARLHGSLITKQKLLQHGWEVPIHPPYASHILPSEFHLFQSTKFS